MIEDPMIPFQQMTNSQILHYILYFPLNNFFFGIEYVKKISRFLRIIYILHQIGPLA
jgi:hypothetical protein